MDFRFVWNRLAYNRLSKEEKLREDYIVQLKREQKKREKINFHLNEAISRVKTLGGLMPICSHCKNVRDDKCYWNKIETYIKEHSDANFILKPYY